VFHIVHEKKPLRVTGIARGAELESMVQELLHLTFLLHGNSVVKGIIS
jgi:hypothetical protein